MFTRPKDICPFQMGRATASVPPHDVNSLLLLNNAAASVPPWTPTRRGPVVETPGSINAQESEHHDNDDDHTDDVEDAAHARMSPVEGPPSLARGGLPPT